MLVLTRRIDEKIVINDNIVITILSIEGEKVKVGIAAPREVTVLRHELWQAIQEQSHIAEILASQPAGHGLDTLRSFLATEVPDQSDTPETEPREKKEGSQSTS